MSGEKSDSRAWELSAAKLRRAHGYGVQSEELLQTIQGVMCEYGIPLDSTYTGKAFLGMKKYIRKEAISGSNVLFIHTGGTPLFFDDVR